MDVDFQDLIFLEMVPVPDSTKLFCLFNVCDLNEAAEFVIDLFHVVDFTELHGLKIRLFFRAVTWSSAQVLDYFLFAVIRRYVSQNYTDPVRIYFPYLNSK